MVSEFKTWMDAYAHMVTPEIIFPEIVLLCSVESIFSLIFCLFPFGIFSKQY